MGSLYIHPSTDEEPISRRRPRLLSPAEVRIIMFEFIDSGASWEGEGKGAGTRKRPPEAYNLALSGRFVWKCLRGVISASAARLFARRKSSRDARPTPTDCDDDRESGSDREIKAANASFLSRPFSLFEFSREEKF